MIRRSVYAALLCGVCFSVLMPSACGLNCLVIRPGRGLVSEKCPNNSVACRMRIENNAIVWYEYSKLYDRNHLACILEGEYNRLSAGEASRHPDWCARKDRGTMRCWCAGSDCNEAAHIRRVYRAFIDAEQGNEYSNELPIASYYPTTAPEPIMEIVKSTTSPHPYFYTRMIAQSPTTISNHLYTNNHRPPKKSGPYWETTTTMRAKTSIRDNRLIVDDVRSDSNSESFSPNAFGTMIVIDGSNFADASTSFSMKIALIGVTVFTLFIVQIGYSI